jgi:transcriptional regulator with XRE-family HTH domain
MNPIANNMKLLRELEGLTQEAMAAKFKTTRPNINVYESGKAKSLPAALVERITTYYGITNKQLLNQRLTKEDLKPTGRIESVIEVKLEYALRENELLKKAVVDKEKIIQFLESIHKVN